MTSIKTSTRFILNSAPVTDTNLNLNDDNATFKLVQKPVEDLTEGKVLVKTLYLSNDPTQRAWIQKGLRSDKMYVDPVREGETMRSSGLAQVVESKSSKYKRGDIVNCHLKWADYCVIDESQIVNKIKDTSIPLTMYLDILGITGLTAYFGLFEVAQLKASDTILISAASGATGSMCVNIAKNVIGCKKVVGISGGAEKCKFVVEQLGADECIDYRSPTFAADLAKAAGKAKFDVFFDGVGGKILDVGLNFVKTFGVVVACGAISGYNNLAKARVNNWFQIITQRLTVKGFIVLDFQSQNQRAIADILRWVKEGKLKGTSSSYSLVDLSQNEGDFKKIPETWGILFSNGKGPGKLLTKVSDYKL